MQRRKVLTVGMAVMAVALTGCGDAIDTGTGSGGSNEDAAGAGEVSRPAACDEENPYLAVALPNLTNPYYVAMQRGFQEAGAEAGFEVEVQIANDDDAAQLAQVQAMLQKSPCALALNAVKSEPAAAIVRAANDAGVPVFTVNVIVDPAALESQGATIVQYLGADNEAGGAQIGEQVLTDMGADAALQVGLITEPDEVPVVQRDAGFQDALSANPNAQVVAEVDGNVQPDDSLAATGELLQGNPDVNVLFASTGPAAFGALQAVQGSGRDVKVYGFCASEEPLTEQYPACVAQEPEDYGRRVVEQVRTWVDGGTVEEEILRPLKMFTVGQTPGEGEVG
ncbi:substrate-binding domain-containing protein [Modestobacter sp. I12A-02662]|uniref:substrate-binding domain-containing protein n=1 Tax=Modestobacter sp. I12A-02662 TaxID=1730496 RepID=UPI0034E02E82